MMLRVLAFDALPQLQELGDRFSTLLPVGLAAEVSVQEIEASGARYESADTAIEVDQVQHPAARRHGWYSPEIFQIEEVKSDRTIVLPDHDVGLLQIAS